MPRFEKDLDTYRSLRERIRKKVEQITNDPYTSTERLGHPAGAINLKERLFFSLFVHMKKLTR